MELEAILKLLKEQRWTSLKVQNCLKTDSGLSLRSLKELHYLRMDSNYLSLWS